MSHEEYSAALKAGKKEYNARLQKGLYPYLPVLDETLSFVDVDYEISIGLCEVPIEQLVGTKNTGRNNAFAANFMPLLSPRTEFAGKWMDLCTSLQEDGLRDPVKAYEYMNRFYVVEGNKRVSVLKFLDAYSVPCNVIRVVPKRSEEKDNKIYYEFLDFYAVTGICYITFSEEGRYASLLALTGSGSDGEKWNADDRISFNSVYTRFRKAFEAKGGKKLPITIGDALLAYLTVFGYEEAKEKQITDIKDDLPKIWDELLVLTEDQTVSLQMDPPSQPQETLYRNILNFIKSDADLLRIAFFYEKTPAESSWAYSHELGRLHLEGVFGSQIETTVYDNIVAGENDLDKIEQAIEEGHTLLFTTSPTMISASLKAAAKHPDVKILNCSLNISHPTLRTYYARMYEAKFVAGAIAGVMTTTDKIGYLANYPIYGMAANINAFALGAKMVNPHAKIYLDWTTLKDREEQITKNPQINYIMDQDMITPKNTLRHFGLYHTNPLGPENLAMTTWHWGKLYDKIVRIVLNGTWKTEKSEGTRAINYWWGMSSGVVDLICSQNLPNGTKRLVDLLKYDISEGHFSPFSGIFHAQDGTQKNNAGHIIPPEDIMTMDWLVDNVIGSIPSFAELSVEAQAVTKLQGLDAVQETP